MKKLVCFSIIYLSLLSYAKKNDGTFINPVTIVDTIPKSYLALGDSYTIGESVARTERFPVQTVRFLRAQNIDINNPDIIATTGWTTTNLLNALDNNPPPKKSYSVVTLLIGVNNQYQGKTLDEYKIEFTKLMNIAISYAGDINHVFVFSIPDYSVTPFARNLDTAKIAKEIDAFNLANRIISHDAGVHYLDITPISRDAKNDPALIADDGLHPSGIQYKKWSELLAPMMLKELY